jgi:hypothetical protein
VPLIFSKPCVTHADHQRTSALAAHAVDALWNQQSQTHVTGVRSAVLQILLQRLPLARLSAFAIHRELTAVPARNRCALIRDNLTIVGGLASLVGVKKRRGFVDCLLVTAAATD